MENSVNINVNMKSKIMQNHLFNKRRKLILNLTIELLRSKLIHMITYQNQRNIKYRNQGLEFKK